MFGGEETKACCVSCLVKLLVDSSGLHGQCHTVNGLSTKVRLEWDRSFNQSFLVRFQAQGRLHRHSPASLCLGNAWADWHPCSTEYICVLSTCIMHMYSIYYMYILCVYTHTPTDIYFKSHLENCPKKQRMPCFLPVSTRDFISRICPSEVLIWRWYPEPCVSLKRRVCKGGNGWV